MNGFMLLIFAFINLTSAGEGGMGSGGGKGIVCFSDPALARAVRAHGGQIFDEYLNAITSIEVLDLRYARQGRGVGGRPRPLFSPLEAEPFDVYLHRLLERLSKVHPDFYGVLDGTRAVLDSDQMLWRDSPLRPVFDDADVASFQSLHCTLTTLAVQSKLNGRLQVHIDSRLFEHPKHGEWSKAVLLLHEYVYALARERGERNSRSTRELVSVLLLEDQDAILAELNSKHSFWAMPPIVDRQSVANR